MCEVDLDINQLKSLSVNMLHRTASKEQKIKGVCNFVKVEKQQKSFVTDHIIIMELFACIKDLFHLAVWYLFSHMHYRKLCIMAYLQSLKQS